MDKQIFQSKKTKIIKYISVILFNIIIFFIFYNNYELYDTPIGKITNITESYLYERENSYNCKEDYYKQSITAVIKNGDYKNNTVYLENIYGESCVYDDKYVVGNSVFINKIVKQDSSLAGNISGLKRDQYVMAVFLILISLLIIVGGKQGFFTIICLFINTSIFFLMLFLNLQGINIFLLSTLISIFFSSIVLFLINGKNKITIIALVSTLSSVAFVVILSSLVMAFSKNIDYGFMEYLEHPYEQSDANLLFLSEILMGGLGVIIDISVTITSCASALIDKNPHISKKSLLTSCREVSDDITGTMINVVFFTNVASCIPLFVISMKNGINFITIIKYNIFFELVRFLTGSIGIIVAIPLSILAVMLSYGRRNIKC